MSEQSIDTTTFHTKRYRTKMPQTGWASRNCNRNVWSRYDARER